MVARSFKPVFQKWSMKFLELSPLIYYEKSFQNTLLVEVEGNLI